MMRSLAVVLPLTVVLLSGTTLHSGNHGADVQSLQTALNTVLQSGLQTDGIYGAKTAAAVSSFERQDHLHEDGIAGSAVLEALARQVPDSATITEGAHGDAVRALQDLLKQHGDYQGPIDGVFGARTLVAVKALQQAAGLHVDGIVGTNTLRALATKTITIQRGDTLSALAGRYGVSESALMHANHLKSANLLLAGRPFIIPFLAGARTSTAPAPALAQTAHTNTTTHVTATKKPASQPTGKSKAAPSLAKSVPLGIVGPLSLQEAQELIKGLGSDHATFFLPAGAPETVVQLLRTSGETVAVDGMPLPKNWKAEFVLITHQNISAAETALLQGVYPLLANPSDQATPVGGEPLLLTSASAPTALARVQASANAQHLKLESMAEAYGFKQ